MVRIPEKPLIPGRVMMIGEGIIPREIFEKLEDAHAQVFMREPDPCEWPLEMDHLVEYLPAEERADYAISKVLKRHDERLRELLGTWIEEVFEDFQADKDIARLGPDLLKEGLLRSLRSLITQLFDLKQNGEKGS